VKLGDRRERSRRIEAPERLGLRLDRGEKHVSPSAESGVWSTCTVEVAAGGSPLFLFLVTAMLLYVMFGKDDADGKRL
jgi:hypothetical protein